MSGIKALFLVSGLFYLSACVATLPETYHKTEVEEVIKIGDLPPEVLAALPKEYDKREFTYPKAKEAAYVASSHISMGAPFAASGYGTENQYGRSLEATAVGSSLASLQPLFPAPAKPR